GGRRRGIHRDGEADRHQDPGKLERGGEDRLGSYQGEDPRGPETLHRQGDRTASVDHAGDHGSISPQYLEDASGLRGHAERVFIPESDAESSAVLRDAGAKGVPVTIAGAGTGLTGARVPFGGWVLSMERFTRIEIQTGHAIAGAGALLRHVQAAAARTGQF